MIINIYYENAMNSSAGVPGEYYVTNKIFGKPICSLTDIISGRVTREINTEDVLEFEYTTSSPNSNELQLNRIVEAKSDPYRQTQYFRIQSIDKDINGIISVYALHICYDLMGHCSIGWPVFSTDRHKLTNNINREIYDSISVTEDTWPDETKRYQRIKKGGYFYYDLGNDLVLESDMEEFFAPDQLSIPVTLRDMIISSEYSLFNAIGGEIEFDRYNIIHKKKIGSDKGYRIEYGTNMLSYEYSETMDNVYSDILPYWIGDWQPPGDDYPYYKNYVHTLNDPHDGTKTDYVKFLGYDFHLYEFNPKDSITLNMAKKLIPIYYTNSSGTKKRHNFTKILPVDVTEIYDSYFRTQELLTAPPNRVDIAKCGIIYILSNNLGNYSMTLSIDFTDLSNVSEYKEYKQLMTLEIGDTVTISNKETNVLGTAECIRTVYNIITDSYESMELGDIKVGFEKVISKNLKTNNRIFYNKKIR